MERMSPPIEESNSSIGSPTRLLSKKRTSKSSIDSNSNNSNNSNNSSSNNNNNSNNDSTIINGSHSNTSHLLSPELKDEQSVNSEIKSLDINNNDIDNSNNINNNTNKKRDRQARSRSRSNSRGSGGGNKNSRSTSRDKENKSSYRKSSSDSLNKYKISSSSTISNSPTNRSRSRSKSRSKSRERRRSSNSSMSSVYKEKRRSRSRTRSISRSRSRDRKRYSGSGHRSSYDSSSGRRTSNSSMSSSKKYRSRSSRSSRSRSRSRSRSKSRERKHRSLSRGNSRSNSRSRSRSRKRRDRSRSNSRSSRKKRDRSRSRSTTPTGKKRSSGWDNLPSDKKDTNIAQVPTTIIYPQQSPINYQQSQFIPSIMVPNVHPISGHPQYPHHIAHQLLSHQFVHIPPQPTQPQQTSASTTSPIQSTATVNTTLQDQCRVYIGNLHFSLGEDSIIQAFSPFGAIKSILLGKDANGKSKGYAFIEYDTPESATKAIESMSNYVMAGRVIKVARPLAGGQQQVAPSPSSSSSSSSTLTNSTIQSNPQQAAVASTNIKKSSSSSDISKSPGDTVSAPINEANRIYIGSINWNVTEDQIRGIFSQFGKIVSCFLMQNTETGKHKGYGFIDFDSKKSADDALTMNGFELVGRAMKVGRPTKGVSASSIPSNNGSIDKTSLEGETMLTTTDQRIQLTQKLLGNENRCLVLRNAGSSDDIDASFEEDIRSGCNEFGEIDKLVIKTDSPTVRVYIVFKEASSCVACQSKLNGKFFSFHCIKAEFYDINLFNKQVYM